MIMTDAASKLRAAALELANCAPGDELVNLADLVERFRLEYATRLRQDAINDLERAESYIRDISGEDEELRQRYGPGTAHTECRSCGNAISESGKCFCWMHLAEALEQFAGYGFDNAAQEASEMWETMSDESRQYVWSGEWLAERAWCPYCGDWQRDNRDNTIHHPLCETQQQVTRGYNINERDPSRCPVHYLSGYDAKGCPVCARGCPDCGHIPRGGLHECTPRFTRGEGEPAAMTDR